MLTFDIYDYFVLNTKKSNVDLYVEYKCQRDSKLYTRKNWTNDEQGSMT